MNAIAVEQLAKIYRAQGDAPMMFLDEATTGMDPLMKRRVIDRIRAEARTGRTVLLEGIAFCVFTVVCLVLAVRAIDRVA